MATSSAKSRVVKNKATKKTRKRKENNDPADEFNIDEVLYLGGDEEDFKMLESIHDGEAGDKKQFDNVKEVNESELKEFMQTLGFNDQSEKESKNANKIKTSKIEEPKTSNIKEPKTSKIKEPKTSKIKEPKVKTTESSAKKSKDKTSKKDKEKKSERFVQHPEISSTSSEALDKNDEPIRKKFLVQPGGKWYDEEEVESKTSVSSPPDSDVVEKYRQRAVKIFEAEVALYAEKKSNEKTTSNNWMQTVIKSGTLGDKMAALTVMIQDSSIHNFGKLDTLIAMTKKKGRREAIMAMETLKELWLSHLLLENRKLKSFSQHPFDQLKKLSRTKEKAGRDKKLLLWYFEELLKNRFQEYLEAVQVLSHDTVSAVKTKAISTIYDLLVNTPEQEKILLSQLVNKLGDPDYKIAAKVSHLLGKLVEIHPQMKAIVAGEVETVLYRPNIGVKAQYYAICFLNQFVLSHEEPELATKLITIYFSFFRTFVKKKEVDGKMLSALLTGVNRAYPYAKVNDDKINEQMNTIFRVIHIAPFNTGLLALMLLFQVMDARQSMSDRYYMALYKKLTDPELKNSPRQPMFLNLLYKSLKADMVLRRIKAFIKRLLQICSCQPPTFICGALFLTSEIFRAKDGLRSLSHLANESDDEEEKFKDVETESDKEDTVDASDSEKPVMSSWVHHKISQATSDEKSHYDSQSRNPLYCGAEHSILWELEKLAGHYHPSVAHFAQTILNEEFVDYTGNPLQDFTLMRFLDRFVYRNPKKVPSEKSSVMQPKSKTFHLQSRQTLAVNSDLFIKKSEQDIPLDQLFFHRYFSKKEENKQKKKKGDVADLDSDASSVSDVEFDDYLDCFEKGEVDIDEDVDFASEFSRSKGRKNKKKGDADDDSDESEDLEDPDLDDDSDLDFGAEFDMDDDDDELDEENFGDEESEEEEEEIKVKAPKKSKTGKGKTKASAGHFAMDSDDEGDMTATPSQGKRKNRKQGKGQKKKTKTSGDLHNTAEEFGSMMDENIGSKFDNMGLNAMANRDKADAKQLKWEMARDLWVRDADFRSKKKARRAFKTKGKFRPKNQKKTNFKRK
ncbi:CCAAT/enhancer-binding protein zeta-like [Glandiceps talaboti]